MKTTVKFTFTRIAYICFLAVLLLCLATSCNDFTPSDPGNKISHDPYKVTCSLYDYSNDMSATILVLHKDPEYGKNPKYSDKSGIKWKAFPNSEDNIDIYLKADGYMPIWKGEDGSNFNMGYNPVKDEVIIQPWPYIGLDGTVLNKEEKRNLYTIDFQGESYYMFNPVVIDLPSKKPYLINYRNGRPIKYITLFSDYTTYGTYRMNDFEPEDEYFYGNANLPLPETGIERGKIYIYILNKDFNLFEYGRRAGLYTEAASVYTSSHPNDPDKYQLIEYDPVTDNYCRLH